MDMSQNVNCQSCQGYFDGQEKIPMILPCRHHICAECALCQYQQTKSFKCAQQDCQLVHKMHLVKLQEDSQLLKHLEQQRALNSIALLEKQQIRVRQSQALLIQVQNTFIQQLIKHINCYIFKDCLELQREQIQVDKAIRQQLKYLKVQQNLIDQQGDKVQLFQQNFKSPQMEERIQQLENEIQRVSKQISQASTNVFEDLASVKSNLNQATQAKSQYEVQILQLTQQSLQQKNTNFQEQIKVLTNKNQEHDTQFDQQQSKQLQEKQSQHQIQEQSTSQSKQIQQNYQQASKPKADQKIQPSQTKQDIDQDIQITIISPNNKKVLITAKQDTTIKQIKDYIFKQSKLYSYTLDLQKNNNSLENNQTISFYQIMNGEKIQMVYSKSKVIKI